MNSTNTWLRYKSGENITERLRMQRVRIAVPVLVRGKEKSPSFEKATHSVLVNARGGIVRLSVQVVLAQKISLYNATPAEEMSGIVTYIGLKNNGKRDISIDFCEPSVSFWGIAFPGWTFSDRKRRTHKPQERM